MKMRYGRDGLPKVPLKITKLWWRVKCVLGKHKYVNVRNNHIGKVVYQQCLICNAISTDTDRHCHMTIGEVNAENMRDPTKWHI